MAKMKRHEIPESREINTTPMIDVIFQLLIFFMLTSSLTKPTQIELSLPKSTTGTKSTSDKTLVVTYRILDGNPEISLDGQPVSGLEALAHQMKTLSGKDKVAPVDIRIEKSVPYQDVIAVMDTVRDAGFPKFSLLTLAKPVVQKDP